MSENDRMERAKRIRRMREGQRDGEETSDEDTASADTAGQETTEGNDRTAETNGTDDPTTDGGAATSAETHESGDAEPAPENTATEPAADDTVTDTVGDLDSTSAAVPSTEEMEAAMEQTMAQAEPVETDDADEATSDESDETTATGPAGVAEQATSHEEATRVLEFTLANEQYCLDIEYIEEIVKQETITRVPNTPEFVEGVVDLRGQITTILNPKVAIGKDDKTPGELIVVFDAEAFDDQGHIGWVVDDVRQVSPVTDDQVNDPPMGEDYINGVIDREEDEEFVIWTTPDLALEEAE